jgi:cytochrome b561
MEVTFCFSLRRMSAQLSPGVHYSPFAMVWHWLIAVLVIVNWRIAETAEHAPKEEAQAIMSYHMSFGVVILVLTLLRLAWRMIHRPPPLASHLMAWERALAKTVHTLFYVLLIAMPLAGWVAMSSMGFGVNVFGLFELPALPVSKSIERGEAIFEAHALAGTILLLLVVVHVAGSLKHTLIDRDGNLFRMLPFGKAKG